MDDEQPSDTPVFYRKELQRACEECSFGVQSWDLEPKSTRKEAKAFADIVTREHSTLHVELSLKGYTVGSTL